MLIATSVDKKSNTTTKYRVYLRDATPIGTPSLWGEASIVRRPLSGETICLRYSDGDIFKEVIVESAGEDFVTVVQKLSSDIDSDSPSRQGWLNSLKPGDKVIIRLVQGSECWYYEDVVTKTYKSTPVMEIVRNEVIATQRNTFNSIGRGYGSQLLVEPSPRSLNEVARTILITQMEQLNWKRLPAASLKKLVDLVGLMSVPDQTKSRKPEKCTHSWTMEDPTRTTNVCDDCGEVLPPIKPSEPKGGE